FRRREDMLRHIVKVLNEKYGEGTVELSIREQYLNMKEKVEECFEVVEKAEAAIKELGIEPITLPERGGTDGARLSFMGLPCPNLGTGGYAFHGPYEHVTAEGMDKAVEVILGIIKA
ncbi:MAG: M20/M25/M40 family metallo-hydrolase, partial [Acetivibrio ethanolgignens]